VAPPRPPASKPAPIASPGAADNTKPAAREPAPASTPAPSPQAAATAPESSDDGDLEFTLPPGELDRVFVTPNLARPPGIAEADPARAFADDEIARPAAERIGGIDVAEDVRREVLAGLRQRPLEEPLEPPHAAMRMAWGGAAAALTLLLIGQIIHENSAWLAAHGPLRGPLQGVYGALGVKVLPPANLSAYQLRQWGVTGDPSAAGTLRVRASILNTGAQLQPYPLLRVTLANRFGAHVGARDFEPAEYLGRPVARLMTPGERADATLDIQDPGKDAEGFEIDVCLRGPDQTVSCAADAAPQTGAPPAKP
jgi:hypothetical protein